MLTFVIPLLSPKLAKSWQQTTRLLERCLKSVCNQTSSNFRVLVVCHEKPNVQFEHPDIHYIEVDFPIPEPTIEAKTLDRGRKTLKGLLVSEQFKPTHVMFVDADDCISKHLAEFVEKNSKENGWLVGKGYIYREGNPYLFRVRRNFYDLCGTCNIIRYDLYDLNPLNLVDADFVMKYYGGHTYIREMLKAAGNPLQVLPFEGAVYSVENGENYYNSDFDTLVGHKNFGRNNLIQRLNTLRSYRFLTHSLKEKFNLYTLDQ